MGAQLFIQPRQPRQPRQSRQPIAGALAALLLLSAPACLGKRKDASDPTQLASAARGLASSPVLVDQSNLIRSSGPALYVRIKALFPDQYAWPGYEDYFSLHPPDPLDTPLGSKDRPTGTLAQYSLRKYALSGCQSNYGTGAVFRADDSILMEGETLPTDPFVKAAFAGARNVWLFPYAADSDEVKTLADTYKQISADKTGKLDAAKEAEGLQSLCTLLLSAPQFWVGNPKPADALRRTVLELAHRIPTFKEYSDYLNKKRTLADLVKEIQGTDNYMSVLREWHKEWLGFFRAGAVKGLDLRPATVHQGSYVGTVGANLIKFKPGEALSGSFAHIEGGYLYAALDSFPATCEHREQAFDPRSTEIRWEQKNPVNGLWETIGSWKRDKSGSAWLNTWSKVSGKVTLATGAKLTTSLSDIQYAYSRDFVRGVDLPQNEPLEYIGDYLPAESVGEDAPGYHYTGKLRATPMRYFNKVDRRVRRFGMDGTEQNGMSRVTGMMTGTPMYVCNTLDRYFASCAYRPNERDPAKISFPPYEWYHWNAGDTRTVTDGWLMRDTFMNPVALESMACGAPNASGMERLGSAALYAKPLDDPYETVAYPRGYSDLTTPAASLAINPVASYLTLSHLSTYSSNIGLEGQGPYFGQEDYENVEVEAILQAQRDINDEPFRLVEDLVRNRKPYSGLVTAPYTYGGEAYETILRGQGYFLPVDPPGFSPTRSPAAIQGVHQINFNEFADIPLKYLESVTGTHHNDEATYFKDLNAIGRIRPKVHSGILNMPAFLSAAAPALDQEALGMRTMSARYFERLLCMSPSSVTLTPAQSTMQTAYIPLTEGAAKDHLDPNKGCYGCHVNLDPLASALSPNFGQNIYSWAMGDLRIMDPSPYYQGSHYGIRGGGTPGEGAFLGQKITGGVRQIGQVLAESPDFYRCVATRAFENLYGRGPAFSDVRDFNLIVQRFKAKQIYNDLILDLVNAPTFEKGN